MNPQETFTELIAEIKRRYGKQMKLIYAYFVPDFEDMHQFLLIAKQTRIVKDKKVVLYAIIPVIKFGDSSLEMFHLCKQDGKLDLYFQEFFKEPITLDSFLFNGFIKQCGLSLNKDDKNYWKKIEGANSLIKEAEELGKINATKLMNHAATDPGSGT